MAYTLPKYWQHGEYPTAADMNKYKDGLDAIRALSGDAAMNLAVRKRLSGVQSYFIVNRYRWLLYRGAGRIDDPADVEETVTLPASSGWTAYDLTQIDWIFPGRVYQVELVDGCFEDYEAI